MIFSPTFYRDDNLSDFCSYLTIQTDDGVELEGVIFEPKNTKETLLVFLGRNHDSVGVINKLAACYKDVRVITFNYRSYGKSGGIINEKNTFVDALKIAELIQKNYGDFSILGFSIGSSVASYIACKHKIKSLFLVGAFDSIVSLAKSKFKYSKLIKPLFVRYKFETFKFVRDVNCDTYLFASKNDKITYIKNARNLKNSIKNLKYYIELDNLSHKEILWDSRVVYKINEVLEL